MATGIGIPYVAENRGLYPGKLICVIEESLYHADATEHFPRPAIMIIRCIVWPDDQRLGQCHILLRVCSVKDQPDVRTFAAVDSNVSDHLWVSLYGAGSSTRSRRRAGVQLGVKRRVHLSGAALRSLRRNRSRYRAAC